MHGSGENRVTHVQYTAPGASMSVYQYVRILPVQGTVGPYGSNAIVKGIAAVRKIDFRFFQMPTTRQTSAQTDVPTPSQTTVPRNSPSESPSQIEDTRS